MRFHYHNATSADHQALWEACVVSGFAGSEWWPKNAYDRSPLEWKNGTWGWSVDGSYSSVGWRFGPAMILESASTWAAQSLNHYAVINHNSGADIHAAWEGGKSKRLGSGANLTLALINCYALQTETTNA